MKATRSKYHAPGTNISRIGNERRFLGPLRRELRSLRPGSGQEIKIVLKEVDKIPRGAIGPVNVPEFFFNRIIWHKNVYVNRRRYRSHPGTLFLYCYRRKLNKGSK